MSFARGIFNNAVARRPSLVIATGEPSPSDCMEEAMNTPCHGEERSDAAIQPFDRLTALSGVEGLDSSGWIAAPAKPG